MADCTRERVRSLTRSGRLITLDTVPSETPARAATSFMLGDTVLLETSATTEWGAA